MKRVLILTASFGEGHNTAAKSLRQAVLAVAGADTEVLVVDPYSKTNPKFNRLIQVGYSVMINRYPKIWNFTFSILSLPGLLEGMLPAMQALQHAIRDLWRDFQPDIVVSTYPVFSFFVARLRKTHAEFREPFVMVVTDSTRINSAWYRCWSDQFVVPDQSTVRVLVKAGVPPERVQALGFPVSLEFEKTRPISPAEGAPWRVLYMPSTKKGWALQAVREILRIPQVDLTILTAKNAALREQLDHAGISQKDNVHVLGWTDQMPHLMAASHVFVGKAGGAVVQEALAAECPFVISHVVPGQEEGNMDLILDGQMGAMAAGSPKEIRQTLEQAFAEDGKLWRHWKRNIARHSTKHAARRIAEFLAGQI
ncbi:MAG TPA: glycosyltransferase [Chthoniobacterales bacterium]